MEQGTLIGTCLAIFMLAFAMMFDINTFSVNPGTVAYFIDVPSLLIVLGGTISSVLIAWPMAMAKQLFGIIGKSWKKSPVQLVETLTLIVDVAKIARKNILAIEDALPSIENLFLRGGLRLVVDRVDRQDIVDMLAHQIKYSQTAKEDQIGVVGSAASLCPAWGMLGTLVGLVLMLAETGSIRAVMQSMSVAMLTTLYGVILANLVLIPLASKRKRLKESNQVLMEMIRVGVQSIAKRESPYTLLQELALYLPSKRDEFRSHYE